MSSPHTPPDGSRQPLTREGERAPDVFHGPLTNAPEEGAATREREANGKPLSSILSRPITLLAVPAVNLRPPSTPLPVPLLPAQSLLPPCHRNPCLNLTNNRKRSIACCTSATKHQPCHRSPPRSLTSPHWRVEDRCYSPSTRWTYDQVAAAMAAVEAGAHSTCCDADCC